MLALSLIGLMQIYSATGGPTSIYVTQIYGILLGLVALLVCLAIDYRTLVDKSHFIYGGVLLLLVYVLFFGAVRGGSRRWIDLGAVQPPAVGVRQGDAGAGAGEVLRRQPSRRRCAERLARSRRRSPPCRALVIARQPDLGTAVTLVPVFWPPRSSPACRCGRSASWRSPGC